MSWYIGVLKRYADFSGRARRKEYWMFVLFHLLISLGVGLIDGILGTGPTLGLVYAVAVFLPGVAVSVRRLHDTGRSGWWLLLVLIPFVGAIVLLVFYFLDSEPGTNKYGPNPKEPSSQMVPA